MSRTIELADARDAFRRDGFVSFAGFLAPDALTELQANVVRFIRDVLPQLPREHVFYEDRDDPATLKQIQQMGVHDPYFNKWLSAGPIRDLAESLLDGPVVPQNLQYFNKPPGIGKPTPAHQDGFYFMLDPCAAVTMWLALDKVDPENGCVRYLPGSHLTGMRAHGRTTTLGFSQGITDYPTTEDQAAEVAMHASPGDLLVHHAMTVHRADGNSTAGRARRALGFIYFSVGARQDQAAHRVYQERLKREMADAKMI